MLERVRRALGGSPGDKRHEHSSAQHSTPHGTAPAKYQPHLELLCDKAKDLCSDAWLANKIAIEVKTENGKATIHTTPAESLPYIRAAYAIKKNELPEDVRVLFAGIAA